MTALQAKFSQSRNDMYWTAWDTVDGYVRWTGYDDANWWDNVSTRPAAFTRTGPKSGKTYTLNFETGDVIVSEPSQ